MVPNDGWLSLERMLPVAFTALPSNYRLPQLLKSPSLSCQKDDQVKGEPVKGPPFCLKQCICEEINWAQLSFHIGGCFCGIEGSLRSMQS